MIAIFFLLTSSNIFSQSFIGKTKAQVKVGLKKYLTNNPVRVDFNEYDSLITFDIRDSAFKKVDFIYVFGRDEKCHTEIKLGCNDCIITFLKNNLKSKKYKWKTANDSVYYSNYSNGLKMELFKQDSTNILKVAKLN